MMSKNQKDWGFKRRQIVNVNQFGVKKFRVSKMPARKSMPDAVELQHKVGKAWVRWGVIGCEFVSSLRP